VLGALAVAGLIMTAAVVTPSSAFADEPSRPLSIEASQGFGSIHEMAVAALLATDPSGTSKLDTWLQNYGMNDGMDVVEDIPARTSRLDTWLQNYGMNDEMDVVEDIPARTSRLDTWLQNYGMNDGMDVVEDIPARTSRLDTWLQNYGMN
jgi:hypothetical protein